MLLLRLCSAAAISLKLMLRCCSWHTVCWRWRGRSVCSLAILLLRRGRLVCLLGAVRLLLRGVGVRRRRIHLLRFVPLLWCAISALLCWRSCLLRGGIPLVAILLPCLPRLIVAVALRVAHGRLACTCVAAHSVKRECHACRADLCNAKVRPQLVDKWVDDNMLPGLQSISTPTLRSSTSSPVLGGHCSARLQAVSAFLSRLEFCLLQLS